MSTNVTGSVSAIQGQFAKNATITPHKAIAAAESFITYVTSMTEAGLKPSASMKADGVMLGNQLHQSTIVYEFNSGVELHAITCPKELNNKVEEIGHQITHAQNIRDRLQSFMTTAFA